MKFFLSERNLGADASKEQALALIDMLVQKGWDVEYGVRPNQVTDDAEYGQEEKHMDAFTDDFMPKETPLTKMTGQFFCDLLSVINQVRN